MKMKTTVKTRMAGQGLSHSRTHVLVRDLAFDIDEPAERSGTNAGPSPTETALSSLLGCTNVIAHKCAARLGIDIGELKFSAVCDFNRLGVTLAEEINVPFEKIVMTVEAGGSASQSEVERVRDEVEKYCPVSKLFRQAGTQIVETWRCRE